MTFPLRSIAVLVCALTWGCKVFAADTTEARKGALVFSDDFTAPEVGKAWKIQWPGLTVADGALNISHVKPEHSAVGLVAVGKKDVVIEFKFKLGAATGINAVCDFYLALSSKAALFDDVNIWDAEPAGAK